MNTVYCTISSKAVLAPIYTAMDSGLPTMFSVFSSSRSLQFLFLSRCASSMITNRHSMFWSSLSSARGRGGRKGEGGRRGEREEIKDLKHNLSAWDLVTTREIHEHAMLLLNVHCERSDFDIEDSLRLWNSQTARNMHAHENNFPRQWLRLTTLHLHI